MASGARNALMTESSSRNRTGATCRIYAEPRWFTTNTFCYCKVLLLLYNIKGSSRNCNEKCSLPHRIRKNNIITSYQELSINNVIFASLHQYEYFVQHMIHWTLNFARMVTLNRGCHMCLWMLVDKSHLKKSRI